MAETFIWLLIVAGALICLLATFLIASERELKKMRLVVGQLQSKIDTPAPASPVEPVAPTPPQDHTPATELMMTNKKLEDEVASLSEQLDENQRTIDQFRIVQHQLANLQAENQQLQAMNQQMTENLASLRNQLQASATDDDSGPQATAAEETQSRLQIAIVELQQKLDESQGKVRELEAAQPQIAELNRELTAAQEQVREHDAVMTRLAEMEPQLERLQKENHRLTDALDQMQKRLNESEARRHQLDKLRQHLADLQTKQASLAAGQRQFEEELFAAASLLKNEPSSQAVVIDPSEKSDSHIGHSSHGAAPMAHSNGHLNDQGNNPETTATSPNDNDLSAQSAGRGKKRSRIASGVATGLLPAISAASSVVLNTLS